LWKTVVSSPGTRNVGGQGYEPFREAYPALIAADATNGLNVEAGG
jgi:hypothetical protein